MPETSDRPADAWATLSITAKAALALCGAFVSIGLFAIGTALPLIEKSFAGAWQAAFLVQMIGAIIAPVFAIVSPAAGKIVSKYGVRRVYIVSLVIFMIGGLGPMICDSLIQILAFRILLGLGVAGGFTAGMAGIARMPENQRHIMFGLTAFLGGGISILAFPLVGQLAQQGWQFAFLIHLILIPLGLLALALPRQGQAVRPVSSETIAPVGRLAGVPPQLLLMAAIFGWGFVASSLYSPFMLASIGVDDPAAIGNILGVMATCSLIGSGSYGFVQKLVGTRGALLLAPALAACGCVALAMSTNATMATASLGLFAVGLATFGAAGYAAAIEAIGPDGDSGPATGVMNFAMYLPQVLFPVVASAIGKSIGPSFVYLMLAGLLVLILAIVGVKPVTRRTPAAV